MPRSDPIQKWKRQITVNFAKKMCLAKLKARISIRKSLIYRWKNNDPTYPLVLTIRCAGIFRRRSILQLLDAAL